MTLHKIRLTDKEKFKNKMIYFKKSNLIHYSSKIITTFALYKCNDYVCCINIYTCFIRGNVIYKQTYV